MTTRDYQVIERETVVLSESEGRLVYTVHRRGQPTVVFLSRSVTRDEVVFENPAHDFPQRIGYRRRGPDELFAWIEGTVDGQQRRVEFPYRGGGCSRVR
jgi:hypothetical protein